MEINQGDIFWFDAGEPRGSSPAYSRPVVVIQNNIFNRSPLGTVLACALTTNLRRAKAPGNVLLNEGETELPKQSVIVVSQVLTIDKSELINHGLSISISVVIGCEPQNVAEETRRD